MDASSFQMYTSFYFGVLGEDFNALLRNLWFDRGFNGLVSDGETPLFHCGGIDVHRRKSNANIDPRGKSTASPNSMGGLVLLRPIYMSVLSESLMRNIPNVKREPDGIPIDRPEITNDRETIRNATMGITASARDWPKYEDIEQTLAILQFRQDVTRSVRELDPF